MFLLEIGRMYLRHAKAVLTCGLEYEWDELMGMSHLFIHVIQMARRL